MPHILGKYNGGYVSPAHSATTGLQGGVAGEHYHLSLNDYVNLTGMTYASNEPTGFVHMTGDSILAFTGSTLTITPTGATFDVMVNGKLFKKTGDSITIPNVEGLHHIAYNSAGTLVNLGTTGVSINDFIRANAYVANVYWNAANGSYVGVGDERHGVEMDSVTHEYLHRTFGSRYMSGLAPFGITADASPVTDASAVVGVEAGLFLDEDIQHNKAQAATGATIPVIYMSGAAGTWRKNSARIHPVMTGGTGRVAYNSFAGGNWSVTEVTNGKYVLYHLFASNSIHESIISLMGQAEYTNLADARVGATTEIGSLVTQGLPTPEFVPIATIIFESQNTYTNSVSKARIRTSDLGAAYIDWRTAKIGPSSSASDHGALAGLSDDDHLQYQTSARTEAQLTGTVHTAVSAATVYGKYRNIYAENITAGRTVGTVGFSSDTRFNNTAAFQADTATGNSIADYFAYTAGTNAIWMGEHNSFSSQIKLTNSSSLVAQPALYAYRSAIDAGGITVTTSPISFSFTNPSTIQNWSNGYMNVDVQGNGASDQVAAYTIMRSNGAGNGIGYKGYATPSNSGHTGAIIGVNAYAAPALNANNSYAAALEATVTVIGSSQTPPARRMGVKTNAHVLVNAASLIVATGTAVSPDALSAQTGHLNFSGAGDLYVQGKAEFDNEVFFDNNQSSSFTAVTGTCTAGTRTYVLASGTFSVYLPAAASCIGRQYVVKNTGSGTITVDGNASETIDTGTTATVASLGILRVLSDGSGWWSV